MTRQSFCFFCVAVLVFSVLSGCATLPRSITVSSDERHRVRESFIGMLARQRQCSCCLDALVTLRFNSFLQSGTVSGYLQTQEPSFLKFVAENPLGQPLMVFSTNGKKFSYGIVYEQKFFEGSVESNAYRKYAPTGFQAAHGFYWLTGRLWDEPFTITDIGRERDGKFYWVKLSWTESGSASYLLFDMAAQQIGRHMLLDGIDAVQLDVVYGGYHFVTGADTAGECQLPSTIHVQSKGHKTELELHFRDWLADKTFPGSDFSVTYPANFIRIQVQ